MVTLIQGLRGVFWELRCLGPMLPTSRGKGSYVNIAWLNSGLLCHYEDPFTFLFGKRGTERSQKEHGHSALLQCVSQLDTSNVPFNTINTRDLLPGEFLQGNLVSLDKTSKVEAMFSSSWCMFVKETLRSKVSPWIFGWGKGRHRFISTLIFFFLKFQTREWHLEEWSVWLWNSHCFTMIDNVEMERAGCYISLSVQPAAALGEDFGSIL